MRDLFSASMLALLAVSMAIPPGNAAHAGVLVDITGDSVASGGASGAKGVTMGWAFTVLSPIEIDGLGFFDVGANGLEVASVPVGLWTSTGTLLAQVAVTDASTAVPSTDANGDWLVANIVPLTLPTGDYLLGATLGVLLPMTESGDGINYGNLITFSPSPDITLTGGQMGDVNGGFEAPATPFLFPVFGPTLFQSVPEPSSLALFGVAIAGLTATRKRTARGQG